MSEEWINDFETLWFEHTGNFNSGADVSPNYIPLTETNVAQFMDEGLFTKLTPSSNDTLLARDLLANEAVEVTISSIAENPEFLINCLNAATPTQLSTIKSILGIV